MARIGTVRVSDLLDYKRDIKGKRLVLLRAGVGSGKNYWAVHLPKEYPYLQILMITSRKNTAESEAQKARIDCKIHACDLPDTDEKDWYAKPKQPFSICTNAYISFFFKHIYSPDDPTTHLWNKFDLIIVDEVHSLTSDASFADSSFAVERFIHHSLKRNPSVDVLAMSGTIEPAKWLFTEEHWGASYTFIDLYRKCIHLTPDRVFLDAKREVPSRILYAWERKWRLIYFVNSVSRMAELVIELGEIGIPEENIGIAFRESTHSAELPTALLEQKESLRQYIVQNNKLPSYVKIFITTSMNKEGISICDDDVKVMFVESHNKADIEQMAGRVRGDPNTGTGIKDLVVVTDARPHASTLSFMGIGIDKLLSGTISPLLLEHQKALESIGKEYDLAKDIKYVESNHSTLRYDYIGQDFCFYEGREQSFKVQNSDEHEFFDLVKNVENGILRYDSSGVPHCFTGGELLRMEWFSFSELWITHSVNCTHSELAANEFRDYLDEHHFIGRLLEPEEQKAILSEISVLIEKYGNKELGFRKVQPKTLGPAVKRFGLIVSEDKNHDSRNKIITVPEDTSHDKKSA